MCTKIKEREIKVSELLVMGVIWIAIAVMFAIKGYYITSLCLIFGIIAFMTRQLIQTKRIRITPYIKWIFNFTWFGLLLLSIWTKDKYPYSQVCCVIINAIILKDIILINTKIS